MYHTPRFEQLFCQHPLGTYNMAYTEWGDPHNPKVLLCVHGLLRTGRDFDVLAQALSQHYRVVCPDIVGRGRSDWLTDHNYYVIPQYVGDVMQLIHHLQPHQLDWVGTSMGGLIGLSLAAALVYTPEPSSSSIGAAWGVPPAISLGKMVLNDVGPTLNKSGLDRIAQYMQAQLQQRFASFEEAVSYSQQQWRGFGPHSLDQWQHLTRYVLKNEQGQWFYNYDPGIAQAFFDQVHAVDPTQLAQAQQIAEQLLWQGFESLSAPCLIVHGADSDLLSTATVQQMMQRQPLAQVYTVQGVAHAPTLMQADQVQAVVDFLLKDSNL